MMRSRAIRNQAGLTLTELVVVSMILSALSAMIYVTFVSESRAFARESARGVTQSDLRVWMVRMVKDVRNAGYDPRGTAAAGILSPATPTSLRFTKDADESGAVSPTDSHETLGYRLNGTSLELLQGTTWRPVVLGVTSLAFAYYDVQGSQVNQTSPYDAIEDIAVVGITITAQASNPPDPPMVISESGRATVRNPK
jgi:prepilin-type N-terminal cleavage/methylation domain-containing protein